MEFINHTPFGAAAYRALDVHALEHDVVVLRTVYRLVPDAPHPRSRVARLVPVVIDEDAPGLVTEDVFTGEPNTSSVLAESDLAPYKPRCDVLVAGSAHAPGGQPAATWLARLRVSHHGEVLLDKTLRVHAPRQFVRKQGAWALQAGEPAAAVPIGWERSWGGTCRVANPRHGEHADEPEWLINEVAYTNPLGCGWWHAGWADALAAAKLPAPEVLPAPQWEYPGEPVTEPAFSKQAAGLAVPQMREAAEHYTHRPAGFGPIGRAWTPRIQLAGSYDDTWLKWSWPNLPLDFDMRHWCCAPADQQLEGCLPVDAAIELAHLVPAALCPSGHAVVELPGHRAGVLWHTASGLVFSGEMVIDTVLVDTEAMTLSLVWRSHLAGQMRAARAELVFQTRREAALFNIVTSPASAASAAEEPAHG
jgi:hypothetical protein